MIANQHSSRTSSGASEVNVLAAWHVKATTDSTVNIREGGGAGQVVIPLVVSAGKVVGNSYPHPLHSNGGPWYIEVVSGTVLVTLSGRF